MLNQLRNTSTYQSTNRPQHGGGSDVQHHALQEIRYYETITKEHFSQQ